MSKEHTIWRTTRLVQCMNAQDIRNNDKAPKRKNTGHSNSGSDGQMQFEHSMYW